MRRKLRILLLLFLLALMVGGIWFWQTWQHNAASMPLAEPDADSSSATPTEFHFFHMPMLLTCDNTQGIGLTLQAGLLQYFADAGIPVTADEAVQICADDASAYAAAIEQAVRSCVPSMIVLHGDAAAQAVSEVQDAYLGTRFLVFGASLDAPGENVCCVTVKTEEAGFLAGYAAVMEGRTELYVDADTRIWNGVLQGAECGAALRQAPITITRGVPQTLSAQSAAIGPHAPAEGDWIATTDPSPEEPPPLTQILLHADQIVLAVLSQWQNGGWEQFYGGKCLEYSFSWGDSVGLSTDCWNFTRFSPDLYQQAVANLKLGSYTANATLPDRFLWVTVK